MHYIWITLFLMIASISARAETYRCEITKQNDSFGIPLSFQMSVSEDGQINQISKSSEYFFNEATWKKRMFGTKEKIKALGSISNQQIKDSGRDLGVINGLQYKLDFNTKTGKLGIELFLRLPADYRQTKPSFIKGRCAPSFSDYRALIQCETKSGKSILMTEALCNKNKGEITREFMAICDNKREEVVLLSTTCHQNEYRIVGRPK